MLKEGARLPQFELPNQDNQIVSSKDFKGKKVVIFFYPKDNTPVCTIEACSFQKSLTQFNKLNTLVYGISTDSPISHKDFAAKNGLDFGLLSDENGVVSQQFKLKSRLFGLIKNRVTFVFDEQGILIKTIDSRYNGPLHTKRALKTILEESE